ncbi:MAG: hypothetical protein WBX25_04075 [Rhodomicrobium sp.]
MKELTEGLVSALQSDEDALLREQLAKAEERLSELHQAASDAIDKLSSLYSNIQADAGAQDEEHASGIKAWHVRMLHQIAKNLAFAQVQMESGS